MKKISVILFLVFLITSCMDNKVDDTFVIGDFSFSSKEITYNTPFTITYKGSDSLKNSLYELIQKGKNYPYDLEFKNNEATITIPDSITAVAFLFKLNDKYENNDKKGYLFPVKDSSGNIVPDSRASLQLFTMNYGDDYGIVSDEYEVLLAIENALEKAPELKEDWYGNHIYIAQQVNAKKSDSISKSYLDEILSKPKMSLKDYEMLSNIYYNQRANKKADSIIEIAAKQFPNSDLAIRPIVNSFFDASDLKEKEAIFNRHEDKLRTSRNGDYILQSLALTNYKKGNIKAFETYVDKIKNKTTVASLYNSIAWPKAEKGEDLESAMEFSKTSINLINQEKSNLIYKPDYYSLNQYKNSLEYSSNMYSDTYAMIAFKSGNITDAIKFQAKAIEKSASAEMYERYIKYLLADKQYGTIVEKSSEFIENGNSTAQLKTYFKEAYKNVENEGDFESILANLEAEAKQKSLDKLRKTLLDDEAPDFTLRNLEGEEVTLSSLKGKTVILDFWATWCGPCIASFPAMQDVVTKYKDNEDVEFFFIDTFEDGDSRLKEVSSFIEENNYSFNVLIDPLETDSKQHLVAKQYKVSGIPTKIIIGPSGNINFKSVGFNGSAEKTVNEIDAMIELLQSKS